MRIVVFDDYRLGILDQDGIYDVTSLIEDSPAYAAPYRMNEFIARFDEFRPRIEEYRQDGQALPLGTVRLRPPAPTPRNFLAAPLNYAAHGDEVRGVLANDNGTARELGFFVKAGGSLSGAGDGIELPQMAGRRFDHEAEVGIVIGREARSVSRDEALDFVFGYTLIVDVTMRIDETHHEERPMRKSFWTFAPSGPCIVTGDEISDPSELRVLLWVNGDLRQDGSLRDLIVDVPGLVSHASSVVPLMPGDLYATGTPAGIGAIVPGDEVIVQCEPIGRLVLPVRARSW